ncbi:TonB-dependent receptor [Mariniphaga sp.]|uniref:TonB-dependent receptor n=1 Tax=Mariniphaga sp. TaxID=1954475 RepID=UPI0035655A05
MVTGVVISPDNNAVPFANVLLLQPADSTLEAGTITGENGKFNLKIKPGAYNIHVSMLGYIPYNSSINIGDLQKQVTLPTILLAENIHELDEVVVNGKRPVFEKEADRTIINVQNSVTSAGNTALEVLEKSPGVVVNRQNGSIALNGKSGVLVMINNKVNRLPLDAVVQMLDGMSAANIGKIELITNPPAKYDAEGNAGIIHIVMKENPDMGTNGSFGLTLGYNQAEILGGNFNLNHRSKNFNAFLNYSIRHDYNRHLSYMERYRTVNGFIESDIDSSIRNPNLTIQNLHAGMEFILTEKTLIHVTATGYQRNWDSKNFTTNLFNPSIDTLVTTERSERGINVWKNADIGTGLKHKFNDNQEIGLLFDYLYYHNNNPNEYNNERRINDSPVTETEQIKTNKKTPVEFLIAHIDYSGKFNEQFTLEAGLKGSWSEFTNDVRVTRITENKTIIDPLFTNFSSLDEKIFAVYGLMNWKLSETWKVNGGLRYELTDSYLGSPGKPAFLDKSYGNFFPNLNVTHIFNENKKLHLA